MVERGELWWADLGEPRGSAPALNRPVIVMQADSFNRSRIRTVIAVIVTTNLRLAALPGNVALSASDTGLPRDGVANVTQLATLDREYLGPRIGALPAWLMVEVERGVRRVLSL